MGLEFLPQPFPLCCSSEAAPALLRVVMRREKPVRGEGYRGPAEEQRSKSAGRHGEASVGIP